MSSENETVADIVAEMLEFADTDSQTVGRDVLRRRIQHFARRIKQAVTDYNHLCNAAKLREAVRGLLEIVCIDCKSSYEIDGKCVKCPRVVAAEAAISAPPRNCDVGTAEEQAERFMKFCEAHKPDEHQFTEHGELLCPSTGCELIACNYGQCALAWAQMPYEEGETK